MQASSPAQKSDEEGDVRFLRHVCTQQRHVILYNMSCCNFVVVVVVFLSSSAVDSISAPPFLGHSQILSCSRRETWFSPELWDKIWEWPGDEATPMHHHPLYFFSFSTFSLSPPPLLAHNTNSGLRLPLKFLGVLTVMLIILYQVCASIGCFLSTVMLCM